MTATVTTSGSAVKVSTFEAVSYEPVGGFSSNSHQYIVFGGGGKELIMRLWQYFQGHNSTL